MAYGKMKKTSGRMSKMAKAKMAKKASKKKSMMMKKKRK